MGGDVRVQMHNTFLLVLIFVLSLKCIRKAETYDSTFWKRMLESDINELTVENIDEDVSKIHV